MLWVRAITEAMSLLFTTIATSSTDGPVRPFTKTTVNSDKGCSDKISIFGKK